MQLGIPIKYDDHRIMVHKEYCIAYLYIECSTDDENIPSSFLIFIPLYSVFIPFRSVVVVTEEYSLIVYLLSDIFQHFTRLKFCRRYANEGKKFFCNFYMLDLDSCE